MTLHQQKGWDRGRRVGGTGGWNRGRRVGVTHSAIAHGYVCCTLLESIDSVLGEPFLPTVSIMVFEMENNALTL